MPRACSQAAAEKDKKLLFPPPSMKDECNILQRAGKSGQNHVRPEYGHFQVIDITTD
jgi:hypothetical protein